MNWANVTAPALLNYLSFEGTIMIKKLLNNINYRKYISFDLTVFLLNISDVITLFS